MTSKVEFEKKLISTVDETIKSKTDINKFDKDGHTFLSLACQCRLNDLIEKLLENGADPDKIDSTDTTPLCISCYIDNPEAVKILVKHHADVNLKCRKGYIPLVVACKHSMHSALFLIENGADVNEMFTNMSPIMVACMHSEPLLVERILEKGAKLDARSKEGWTPLMFACRYQNSETVKKFIPGSDINAMATNGLSALILTCRTGSPEFVQYLIDCGAKIVDMHAMIYLAYSYNKEVYRYLINKFLGGEEAHLSLCGNMVAVRIGNEVKMIDPLG